MASRFGITGIILILSMCKCAQSQPVRREAAEDIDEQTFQNEEQTFLSENEQIFLNEEETSSNKAQAIMSNREVDNKASRRNKAAKDDNQLHKNKLGFFYIPPYTTAQ